LASSFTRAAVTNVDVAGGEFAHEERLRGESAAVAYG
jgi:hypothetical protein